MTPTETAAAAWLARLEGYAPSSIRHHGSASPDFVTPDGKRWEVKLLPHDWSARFGVSQIRTLRALGPTLVLFMRPGADVPAAIAEFSQLTFPGELGQIHLRATWQRRGGRMLPTAEALEAAIAAEEIQEASDPSVTRRLRMERMAQRLSA